MQCPYGNPSRRQSTENHEDQNVPTQTHQYARSSECTLKMEHWKIFEFHEAYNQSNLNFSLMQAKEMSRCESFQKKEHPEDSLKVFENQRAKDFEFDSGEDSDYGPPKRSSSCLPIMKKFQIKNNRIIFIYIRNIFSCLNLRSQASLTYARV